ncbi:Dihydrolipoamide dehydrogenase [hydrothermal vent metagenome]|uniref:Dihydrolipoamide dehydrogenase n=1 Tax=hydrothermal vent metagenome TaxID=652676 RepID=A0A3B0V3M0_9ZZZZ
MKEFDIVIIGGGPGGYVAAIRGAQAGAKVCVIEKQRVGGTCLNRGCIPTKALYYSAKALSAAKRAEVFGVTTGEVSFDIAKAVARKDDVVTRLTGGIAQLLKGNGVELISGTGVITGAGKVTATLADGTAEEITAKKIIIATGSEPALIPAFKIDGESVITSTEALNLTDIPKSLLVIGGGVMGCEFATLFSKFGSEVTIVELLPTILSTEDKQVVRVIAKGFKTSGVEVLTDVMVDSVDVLNDSDGGGVKTTFKDGTEIITEKVLVSIGRSFNTKDIGLDTVGVELENGHIKVNEKMETTVDGIYAIGDVVGGMLLAHVASVEGEVAVVNALGGDKKMDYSVIPAGIFTDPEIASVGLREKDAKEQGLEVKVGRFPYAASGKALAMGEGDGFVQIVADSATDKILGASIVGAHATDLLGEVALAVKAGHTAQDIIDTVHAHPTLPEVVLEAAEDVHARAVHKLTRRGR